MDELKGKTEFEFDFKITRCSPKFWMWLFDELPIVSTIEEADIFGVEDEEHL